MPTGPYCQAAEWPSGRVAEWPAQALRLRCSLSWCDCLENTNTVSLQPAILEAPRDSRSPRDGSKAWRISSRFHPARIAVPRTYLLDLLIAWIHGVAAPGSLVRVT